LPNAFIRVVITVWENEQRTVSTTNMSLTLICLVEGDLVENAFPVNVESSDLVGVLKERIKEKKVNDFQHFDADKLSLYLDDEPETTYDKKPILSESSVKLSPIFEISKYFSSQPETGKIHLVVRPPIAPIKAVAATSQLFSCQAYLKKEKRSFFFEYKQNQDPTDHWQRFQSLIKEAFDKYLHDVDSTVISIQTKTGEIDISSGMGLLYFMKKNDEKIENLSSPS